MDVLVTSKTTAYAIIVLVNCSVYIYNIGAAFYAQCDKLWEIGEMNNQYTHLIGFSLSSSLRLLTTDRYAYIVIQCVVILKR